MKKGILVVSFGTTYRRTREKNIERLVRDVREAYSDRQVYQAYSSDKVRRILKERDKLCIPGVGEALEQMVKEGIEEAALLPTHIIDGIENRKSKQTAEQYRDRFVSLHVAGALLEEEADYAETAEAFWDSVKETAGDRTVILMGHGSSHASDRSYRRMEEALSAYAGKKIYMATAEGKETIETVLERMRQAEAGQEKKEVLLMPFMLVAGGHAEHDMAGKKDSFLSKVRAAGYRAGCIQKGIGEYEAVRSLYINKLRKAEKGTQIG